MENAAKALLIAGGVLISLLVITFLIYMLGHVRTIRNAEAEKVEVEKLQKFNQEYEAYNRTVMFGADVLSLVHKMKDNNASGTYKMDCTVTINGKTYRLGDGTLNDETVLNENKTNPYKCTRITYDSTTGKVKTMNFENIPQE